MRLTLLPVLALLLSGCWSYDARNWSTGNDTADTGSPNQDDDMDGFTELGGDCDDTDANVHPDAIDMVGDDMDMDCDGVDGTDDDDDSYASTQSGGGDCDDGDHTVHPSATETAWDQVDQDCDGSDLHDWLHLSTGILHACGVRSTGELECWGNTAHAQADSFPQDVLNSTLSQIEVGANDNCALTDAGDALCWGAEERGELSPPLDTRFVSLSAGKAYHSCGITTEDSVRCWGLTDGTGHDYGQVTDTPASGSYQSVSAGSYHVCAIANDSTLQCWGAGVGVGGNHDFEQSQPPAGSFDTVSCGGRHTCAIQTSGELECWGDDSDGQVSAPSGPYLDVATGLKHSCGLRTDASVVCWGSTYGDALTAPSGHFSRLFSTGHSEFTCGLRLDGSAECWGPNLGGRTDPP